MELHRNQGSLRFADLGLPCSPPVTCSARSFPGPFGGGGQDQAAPGGTEGLPEGTGFPGVKPLQLSTVRCRVVSSCAVSAPGHPSCPPARPQDGLDADLLPSREPVLCGVPGPTEPWPVGSHAGAGQPPERAGRGRDLWSVCGLTTHDYVRHTFLFGNCFCN